MLKSGNYMSVRKVNEFISKYFSSYADVVKSLPIHQGEFNEYYDTDDIRNVVYDDVFVEMECDCVTYMILDK